MDRLPRNTSKELWWLAGLYTKIHKNRKTGYHKMNLLKIAILAAILPFITAVAAADDLIYTAFFSNSAVGGYDPVAYFTDGKPVKGNDKIKLKYKGATWYFASTEHRRMFQMNPGKYAPQYGGYCAWAIAHDDTAKGDPLQWTIHKNKLYLNYDRKTRTDWEADKDRWIKAGNSNWPKVIQ